MNELETNQELAETQKGDIAIYQSEDGEIRINAKIEDESIWLTQYQLSELFGTERSVLSKHIRNRINEGELY
jgi:hypothetical protein